MAYVMTARRRAALRKAQLASARKRRGRKLSPTAKRRVKRAALVAGGTAVAALTYREVKYTNTYLYAKARYKTGLNYHDSPVKKYERKLMKYRQRQKAFGSGRSTFKIRKNRRDWQRNVTRQRMMKMGLPTYVYRMTRNHTRYDPYVDHALTKLGQTQAGLKVKQMYPIKQIRQANFARSVRRTIRDL